MSERSGQVILSGNLTEFFRDEVGQAKNELGVELSAPAEFYVVNLLCEYSRPESVASPGGEPLALQYKRALEAPAGERMLLLKNLGDVALYVSGFFVEFIERSSVDVDYYISMGGSAYGNLSGMMGSHPQGDTFAHIYNQLAQKFAEVVDLLGQIANRQQLRNGDLVRLYDRWLRTGSDRLRKVLADKGMLTGGELPKEFVQ